MREVALAALRQLLLFVAVLTPLELLAPARRQKLARRGTATDVVHFFVNPFLVGAGAAVVLAALAFVLDRVLPSAPRARLASQPWALQLAEIILVSELGAYWVHRLSHRVGALWRFHAVHHSAVELDWLAAHRQHPLESVWLLAVANLPIVVLGFSTAPLAGFILAQKLYTAFLHSNTKLSFGRLGLLLASPRFHHWHHDGDGRPANFASFLPLLDLIFGTYRLPDGFPSRYGIDEPMPRGYAGQLIAPFAAAKPRS